MQNDRPLGASLIILAPLGGQTPHELKRSNPPFAVYPWIYFKNFRVRVAGHTRPFNNEVNDAGQIEHHNTSAWPGFSS